MKKQAAGSEKAFFSKSGTSCNIQASESLQRLFECMQTETVRRIDGRLLACKITPLE